MAATEANLTVHSYSGVVTSMKEAMGVGVARVCTWYVMSCRMD